MAFNFDNLQKLDTGIPGHNVKTPGFNFGALPEVGAPAAVEEKQPGFVKNIIQEIAKPVLRTVAAPFVAAKGAIQLAKGDVAGAEKTTTEPVDFGYFGKVTPVGGNVDVTAPVGKQFGQFTKDIAGTGLEVASNLVGGEGGVAVGKSLLKSQ